MWIPHEVDSKRITKEIRNIGKDITKVISDVVEKYPKDFVITPEQVLCLVSEYFIACDRCGRILSPKVAIKGKKEKRFGSKSCYTEEPIACYAIKSYEYVYTPYYCKYCSQ